MFRFIFFTIIYVIFIIIGGEKMHKYLRNLLKGNKSCSSEDLILSLTFITGAICALLLAI